MWRTAWRTAWQTVWRFVQDQNHEDKAALSSGSMWHTRDTRVTYAWHTFLERITNGKIAYVTRMSCVCHGKAKIEIPKGSSHFIPRKKCSLIFSFLFRNKVKVKKIGIVLKICELLLSENILASSFKIGGFSETWLIISLQKMCLMYPFCEKLFWLWATYLPTSLPTSRKRFSDFSETWHT